MAVDMFLKIDGVKGESVDHKHADSIDVLSFSWGMDQSGTAHSGPGAGSGKVKVKDIAVHKHIDTSTPVLLAACCSGKHFPHALLTVRKAGEKPVEYLKLKLTDVIITHQSTDASANSDDRLSEHVVLNFAKYEIIYTPQKADGSAGAAVESGWDIAKNQKV
jgi:type VI secretion system secreted protein Hcp